MIDIDLLNFEEKKAIEELQMRMGTLTKLTLFEDKSIFYRFLKARDFDVDKAEKMLRKNIIWRQANQVDTILQDFKLKEFFLKYILPSRFGFDKDGDLLQYVPTGKFEGKDIMKCATLNDYMKHWMWVSEENLVILKQRNEKTGRKFFQVTIIIDLDQLTFGNATNKNSVEQCLGITHILQDNYPENMKAVYVINAPRYYVFMFSILKAVMSHAMLQKVHVIGHSGWKEKLLEVVDADVLPAFLGGTRTDPDGNPLCETFITHGDEISSCYYLPIEDRCFKDKSQVTKILVSQMRKEEIYINVKEEGSLIQWEFLIKNKDIGFGLFFEESENEVRDVLPIQRYETMDGVEIGSYKTQLVGKYIMVFDNSYSWLSSKEVEYCVKVVKSE